MNQHFLETPYARFVEEDGLFEPENWRDKAACRGIEPSEADRKFFADGLKSEIAQLAIQEAKDTCATCPVKADCLQFALVTNQKHGVWGGLTTEERQPTRPEAEAA